MGQPFSIPDAINLEQFAGIGNGVRSGMRVRSMSEKQRKRYETVRKCRKCPTILNSFHKDALCYQCHYKAIGITF